MSKAPWFKFYGADYLLDAKVDDLPLEAQAILVRMWCVVSLDGGIPADPAEIARRCRLKPDQCLHLQMHMQTLVQFFEPIAGGMLSSPRMKRELERSRRTSEARAQAAHAKHTKRIAAIASANDDANVAAKNLHMSEVRSQINSLSEVSPSDDKKARKEPSREGYRLASLLKSEILKNKPDFRSTPTQERNWGNTADLMLRRDKRDSEHIADLIRWVQQDEFWRANILSMSKLREKFDQLELKRSAVRRSSAPSSTVPIFVPGSKQLEAKIATAGGVA